MQEEIHIILLLYLLLFFTLFYLFFLNLNISKGHQIGLVLLHFFIISLPVYVVNCNLSKILLDLGLGL